MTCEVKTECYIYKYSNCQFRLMNLHKTLKHDKPCMYTHAWLIIFYKLHKDIMILNIIKKKTTINWSTKKSLKMP
jgi:hypothetical protein